MLHAGQLKGAEPLFLPAPRLQIPRDAFEPQLDRLGRTVRGLSVLTVIVKGQHTVFQDRRLELVEQRAPLARVAPVGKVRIDPVHRLAAEQRGQPREQRAVLPRAGGAQALQGVQYLILLARAEQGFGQHEPVQQPHPAPPSARGVNRHAGGGKRVDVAADGALGYLELVRQLAHRGPAALEQDV